MNPILVTGCARSGTSMTAGIINLCGASGGALAGPNPHNRKGMFENGPIKNAVTKDCLRKLGCDAKGQHPLPDTQSVRDLDFPVRSRVLDLMKTQGYASGPWFHKDAKLCLIWPVWHRAFPDAKWIIVRRNTDDIINSCLRTRFMNAFLDRDGWKWWVEQHLLKFEEMISNGLNVKVVWAEDIVRGDQNVISELVDWLGLKWNPEIDSFIDPTLWNRGQ